MIANPITTRIREFIQEHFPAARARPLTASDRLLENGVLDSLGILELVAFLENEFLITVTDEDLLPEQFETLDRLTQFVELRRSSTS